MDNNTKTCKNCGQTISKKTKVCPHCYKKQGIRPWMIIVAILVVLFIIGIVNSPSSTTQPQVQSETDTTQATEQPKPEETKPALSPIELKNNEIITISKEQAGKYLIQISEGTSGFNTGILKVNGDSVFATNGSDITLKENDQVALGNCQKGETWTLVPANK